MIDNSGILSWYSSGSILSSDPFNFFSKTVSIVLSDANLSHIILRLTFSVGINFEAINREIPVIVFVFLPSSKEVSFIFCAIDEANAL